MKIQKKNIIFIILCALAFLYARPASAAPVETATSSTSAANVNTLSFPIAVTGVNTFLIVNAGGGDSPITDCHVSTANYNGVPMTKLWQVNDTNWTSNAGFYMLASSSGSHNVDVTYQGICLQAAAGATAYSGVNQSTPVGATSTASATSGTTPSVTITSAVGEKVFASLSTDASSFVSNGTELWKILNVSVDTSYGAQEYSGAAPNVSATWTQASDGWSAGGVSIKPSASGSNSFGMSSGSYRILSDSLNVGGIQSNSPSYIIEDTTGEVGSGDSSSTNFNIHAGYQQMLTSYLAVTTAPSNVTLSPSIPGLTGGTSNGSTSIVVLTDNTAGYQMTIKASSSPALVSTNDSIADYTPAGADPDFTFSIASTASEFGFTPEGSDIVQRFKDNGSACNTGSSDTSSACWAPLSTTNQTIAQSSASNQPSGTRTDVVFRVSSGSSRNQKAGTYYATTTITVLPL